MILESLSFQKTIHSLHLKVLKKIETDVILKTLGFYYRKTNDSQNDFSLNGKIDFVDKLIKEANQLNSSDIHIEIYKDNARIRMRVDGMLIQRFSIDKKDFPELINKIKIKSNLDISEKRLPQDGRIQYDNFDIRVSILPTLYGEKIVLRILGKDATNLNLDSIGLNGINKTNYLNGIDKTNGLVLISGPTGSGKTSIISILNRLYPYQAGQILLDGVLIEDYELDRLRASIGVVLQDVFLFSGSVYDNITLRNPSIRPEQVEEAAKMIGMHDFIMQLPGGYQYHVMERGATLSLGQRQLLSFIRALLYNPSILILDEATSSIDTESEQLIEKAIETLIQGRTSIVIAHRLSTIRKADQILVLEHGKIIEKGTHQSLMEQGGFYKALNEMQFDPKKSN